ncbi:MAG: hypothetical protein M3322_04820 [Actinomycetota bacterium]|nr:hypothetical protein [Actinomycetota bacterium]
MTAVQELAILVRKARSDGFARPSPDGDDPWSHAPAPAQVAKRMLEAVFHRDVHADRIKLLTNVTHWAYGTGLGVMYALVQRKLPFRRNPLLGGPVYGTGAWALSYAMLVPMGLYEPPWHYSAKTIAKDLSYHLVFGTGCAAGYRLLTR